MSKKKPDAVVCGALLLTAFCYFWWSVSGNLYTYLDNMTVSMVSAGMFGNGNYCQYIHPFLCVLVRGLSRVLPSADGFTLFVHVFLLIAVFMAALAGIRLVFLKPVKTWKTEDFIALMLVLLAVLFFCGGMNLWDVNYTVQTGAILFSGLLTLSYAMEKKEGKAWIAAGTVLVFAGYLLRLEADLLFIPFAGLEILSSLLKGREKKERLRECLRYFGPAVLLALLLLASKYAFNSMEPYASDNLYTKYRTAVEDYPMEFYGESGAEAMGIDEETYNLVSGSWILLDTERIDTEMLRRIAECGAKNAFSFTSEGLSGALREMARRVRYTDIYLFVLSIITALLAVRNLAAARSGWLKAEAALAFAGGFIILLYFTFRGRALFRLWQTVLLAVNAVLICNAVHIAGEKGGRDRTTRTVFMLLLCVLLYYSAGQMLAHTKLHSPISPLTSMADADDSAYADTFAGDGLYIWSGWYLTIPNHFAKQNKLPTRRVMEHNIPIGDWTYGQVYFREFLAERNAENPAKALVERPDTYLMDGFPAEVMPYMTRFYGEDLTLEKAGEVNGVTAYRLVKGGRDE